MARFLYPWGGRRAEIDVDEELADALQQLGGSGQAMEVNQMVMMVVIAVVIFLVILALFVTWGKINRSREEYSDGEDLFDQNFGDDDGPFARQDDDFSQIRITREEPGPVTSEVTREPFERSYEEQPEFDPEPAENVVPLRTPEPEPEPMQRAEPAVRREPMQVAATAEQRPSDYDYGQASGYAGSGRQNEWTRGDSSDRMAGRGYDDEDAPFIAPFIRDYIEDSERRQHSRLDDLRDDVRRQLSGIRDEQSNRLDLFLNSIDRKLDRGVSMRPDGEEGASTRRRMDSLSTAVDRMNDAVERQNERLSDLARSVEERFADMSPVRSDLRNVHDDLLTFRRELEGNTSAITSLRDNFDSLKEDFGRLERSFLERAQSDSSVTMRLSEVVRNTLDEDEYELNAKLPNGHKADCVIALQGGRTRIAIDGGFPIECFNRLPSRDAVRRNMPQAKTAEDEFRRTVLRSIFGCADKFIVAGETADSAILFLPSEAAYTILHDRFPDLVRDSHRARVWLTSPSTLMGTLNLLHNVLPTRADDDMENDLSVEFGRGDEGPFSFGSTEGSAIDFDEPEPAESRKSEDDDRAADIEERLRQLREEEQSLAEELLRRREGSERRYRTSDKPRREQPDDFESRLERFSFDIDEGRTTFELDDDEGRRSFRTTRDDDLR